MRGGAKKKDGEPATEENRSERQTFIRGGGVSPCRRAVFAACLSPLYLEHQPHQQEDKTKEKKRKRKRNSTLPFLFKTKHAAGAHGRRLKCGTVILIEFLGLLFSPSFSASLGCPGNLQIGFYSASHPVEVRGRGGSER